MSVLYNYPEFLEQFTEAKQEAEHFILSVEQESFLQRPSQNSWCVAECYSHLIDFGDIYYQTMQNTLEKSTEEVEIKDINDKFKLRWFWKLAVNFFEPPYSIKVKTFEPFEPDLSSDFTREEILTEFIDLQNRFIAQLEDNIHKRLDLDAITIRNPIFSFLVMKLSECYAVLGAHQRRHQWQAQQVHAMLKRGSK